MTDMHDWDELIDRHLRGELTDDEKERLAEWLDTSAASRETFVKQAQWDTELAEALRENTPVDKIVVMRASKQGEFPLKVKSLAALLAVCTMALVVVVAVTFLERPNPQPPLPVHCSGPASPVTLAISG